MLTVTHANTQTLNLEVRACGGLAAFAPGSGAEAGLGCLAEPEARGLSGTW